MAGQLTLRASEEPAVGDPEPVVIGNLKAEDRPAEFRRFRQLSAVTIAASSLVLFRLIAHGRVGSSYQGDEGLRIYDAYQTAFEYPNSLFGSIGTFLRETLFGIHPPGDTLIRSLIARTLDLLGLDISPVSAMFGVSVLAVGVAHYLATDIALRTASKPAAALTLFLLFGSFVFNDIKVSSMGEAIAIPLFLAGIRTVQRVVSKADERRLKFVVGGGLFVLASTFVRPEISMLLPGVCLALWYLTGFRRAVLFGSIAGSFEIAKLANAIFFASEGEVTNFTVGAAYFNTGQTVSTLWRSDFVRQLLSEPAVLIFPAGALASIVFVSSLSARHSLLWRSHLLVFAATVSYLVINIAAQLAGLAPHASYRVVIASGPTMIIGFSLAFVGVATIIRPMLEARFDRDTARLIGVGALVLLCGWGAYDFMTDEVSSLTDRVPEGVRLSAEEVLARSELTDAVFVDRMRYWESGMLGYFADREAPACNYARCPSADAGTDAHWQSQRDDTAVAGTITWAEFNTLRMHSFISEFQPSHIVVAAEEPHRDWSRIASGLWGDDAHLWSSHIMPYLENEIDYARPQQQFLQLGTVNDISYFDEHVLLLPRHSTDVAIVFEAFYGRTPEGVSG